MLENEATETPRVRFSAWAIYIHIYIYTFMSLLFGSVFWLCYSLLLKQGKNRLLFSVIRTPHSVLTTYLHVGMRSAVSGPDEREARRATARA